jgi:uncharacterized protein (DUF58 family)
MVTPSVSRLWRERDRPGWRLFGTSMITLAVALVMALFSAAVARQGRLWLASASALAALMLAGWVGVTSVPALARRTSLRWLLYQVDYRLPKEGIIFLAAVLVVVLAAVNTGNNLLFLILGCLLACILISGVLSRTVLAGVGMKFALPERIFAGQPFLAALEIHNQKDFFPSLSLRVVGEGSKKQPGQILARPVYFPYIANRAVARQRVELTFPRRGVYRQESFGIRTKFPFGLFEKTRRVDSPIEVVVFPDVTPTTQTFELLPLISGEMASYYRGRGHELHSIRPYQPSDSARFVDWKLSAKTGALQVREYAREDERRLMLVFDPFMNIPTSERQLADFESRFERAVSLMGSIAWHFQEVRAEMQFRTDRLTTPLAHGDEIIYEILRELAFLEPHPPEPEAQKQSFLEALAGETEIFKIIITQRPQRTLPPALWSSSYFIFFDSI